MEVVTQQGSFPADLQASASFQQIDPKQRSRRATQEEESRLLPQSTASFWQTQYPQIVDNGVKRPSKWFGRSVHTTSRCQNNQLTDYVDMYSLIKQRSKLGFSV